jgi:calcium channel MID1
MWFGDSTSNQALLFSPIFSQPAETTVPKFPNYTFPPANLSQPDAPTDAPSYTILIAPTSKNLTSLPQTTCAIQNVSDQVGNVVSQDMWLKGEDDGWRSQWLVSGLTPSTNYTTYIIQDNTILTSPAYFVTKSGEFNLHYPRLWKAITTSRD